MDFEDLLGNEISATEDMLAALQAEAGRVAAAAAACVDAIASGHKVLLCGNGGSAADAQHLAAEFVGRLQDDRRSLPALALTTDTSALTAISNDYGFEHVFSRQVEAHARDGDVLVAISTSGRSPNVLRAVEAARAAGCTVVALTGTPGGPLANACDIAVRVAGETSAVIQHGHILVGHVICRAVEQAVLGDGDERSE